MISYWIFWWLNGLMEVVVQLDFLYGDIMGFNFVLC